MLGVLLEQQFQIVPLHDPTSGWSAHIWQNYGPRDRRLRGGCETDEQGDRVQFRVHAP